MEATGLSVGKSVLDGALGYAKSAVAEEVALQLGVQRDHAFIRDELEMMQAFLKAAHGEPHDHEVLMTTWVKQVRDVAYDSEDCLQDFSIHLHKPSWWRFRTLRERRRIAKKMKDLRERVEDISQRNMRYQLFKGAGSKPATAAEQSSITATAIFGINEARRVAMQEKSRADLVQLISQEGEDLKVISVWGTSGDLGLASIINEAYNNPEIKKIFSCRAWVRVSHPFNPNDFIGSLVKQFRSALGVGILLDKEKTGQELAEEFTRYMNENSYLIVLNDLSTFEEWNGIKSCFSNNKKRSRIIVCTPQAEVASLCAGQESKVLELKELSSDQIIYAFCEKDKTKSPMPVPSSNAATTGTINSAAPSNKIQFNSGDQSKAVTKSFTRIKTMKNDLEESQLIGREKESSHVAKLISKQFGQEFRVISVWGMGGLGKTTLVKDVYRNQNLVGIFEKRVFVTVLRPFILKELLKSLIEQLSAESFEKKGGIFDLGGGTRKRLEKMELKELVEELATLLKGKKCLIVLDDLSSTVEWDMIIQSFPKMENTSRIIVTTREENIAKYCSEKQENVYKLKVLEDKDALELFTRKVFKETIDLNQHHPQLFEEAKQILKKCNGLPLGIVTIGGFLANRPKIALEWRKLNEHISAELEINPELEAIRTILSKSYDGLPYHLKSCFLYLSIFPEDHKTSRRRLIRRWTAEGYSRGIREKSAEEIADSYFMELIGRSMILPCQESVYGRKGIDSCQVHDLMREISISKSIEENLVFRLEEGCSLNTQEKVRHLTISSNWKGDKGEFEARVDLSRIRSLTVFGKWRPFFISHKMSFLRVLDLEGTEDLFDHHLEQIGELLHLKYLSLRGCSVFHLPDSLGNLKQLQALDIKNTQIMKLPKTIVNLRKLQYIHAGEHDDMSLSTDEDEPMLFVLTFISLLFCLMCYAPQLLFEDADVARRDLPRMACYLFRVLSNEEINGYGVALPRGFRKLRALQTLSAVDIAKGKGILKEIKRLTQLRRLAVTGINKKNCKEFCSTLAHLIRLESLSVWSMGEPGLHCYLDGVSEAPVNLQSLSLHGNLVQLPKWVGRLNNLVKLKLEDTKLSKMGTTIRVLGVLRNLAILRLLRGSFKGVVKAEHCLTFHREAFPSLIVLELHRIYNLRSVKFEGGTALQLELLQFREARRTFALLGSISGLSSLPSLKEVLLERGYHHLKDYVQAQLDRNPNPNRPVLKMK